MLGFEFIPDQVLVEIVDSALEFLLSELDPFLDAYSPTAEEINDLELAFRDGYPLSARNFGRLQAIAVAKALRDANRSPTVFDLTDYHWLLLHEALNVFCEIHNDRATGNWPRLGKYRVNRIDFDAIIEVFFYDTDFLVDAETMSNLGSVGREMMRFSEETFGLSQGFEAHPDELLLKPRRRDASPAADVLGPASTRLSRYPPSRGAWFARPRHS